MAKFEKIEVSIINDEDYEQPPIFEYITKNIVNNDFDQSAIEEPEVKIEQKGCKCRGRKCNIESNCCPKLVGEQFAYTEYERQSIMCLNHQLAIIECGDKCTCSLSCINRATQHPRDLNLCLFKTAGKILKASIEFFIRFFKSILDRGWGLKNFSSKIIKHGTFIIEYTGELLGNCEAGKREESSFLFDVNMDRCASGFYTIDAHKFGNLSRFVNHSCNPNASIWFVNDCSQNKKTQ